MLVRLWPGKVQPTARLSAPPPSLCNTSTKYFNPPVRKTGADCWLLNEVTSMAMSNLTHRQSVVCSPAGYRLIDTTHCSHAMQSQRDDSPKRERQYMNKAVRHSCLHNWSALATWVTHWSHSAACSSECLKPPCRRCWSRLPRQSSPNRFPSARSTWSRWLPRCNRKCRPHYRSATGSNTVCWAPARYH